MISLLRRRLSVSPSGGRLAIPPGRRGLLLGISPWRRVATSGRSLSRVSTYIVKISHTQKNVRGTRSYCSIYITRLLWRVSSGGRATEGRGSVGLLGRLGRGTGSGNYTTDKTELLHVHVKKYIMQHPQH